MRPPDRHLLDLVAATAAGAEARGALDPAVVLALREAGVFAALIPAALGGGEAHPNELRAAIEAIAEADAAAGWCAAIAATAGLAAAYLPPPDAARLLGGDSIPAGVFAPRGTLRRTANGAFELSGRWQLASGVSHASVVGLGCVDPGGRGGPLYAVLPREQVEVIETWDPLGLRATASHESASMPPRCRRTASST